jgi:hypothetical protein
LTLADVTNRHVLGRNIAGRISPGTDCQPSQSLASALYSFCFEGVFYSARHDPAFRSAAWPSSAGRETGRSLRPSTNSIPLDLIQARFTEFGLSVLPSLI